MDNEGDSLFSGLFAGSCFHGTYQQIYPAFERIITVNDLARCLLKRL